MDDAAAVPESETRPQIRLADFLRARRASVSPEDVGLRDVGSRRVPGLRRDEVAQLAGISETYYVHLEQGRDQHPSPHVLEALAGPLKLDAPALNYAKRLAEALPPRRRAGLTEQVRPEMLLLLNTFDRHPAVVIGRYRDVLAANRLATALNPGFTPGVNILRFVFLDPEGRAVYINWEEAATEAVRTLRFAMGAYLDDGTLTDLVSELLLASEDFRRIWERHEVREKTIGAKRFDHPVVGPIALEYQSLTISGSEGQSLSIYSARPGGHDEETLARLIAYTQARTDESQVD
jgi:transcriptional regulator with XRE-family HTH domain